MPVAKNLSTTYKKTDDKLIGKVKYARKWDE
jgi:hypothetical protein